MQNIHAVLFDMDGTLLDTAQDLISALQTLMQDLQLSKKFDLSKQMRAAAGAGCRGLIKAGLNIDITDARYPALAEKLLNHYQNHLLETTQLFPGMAEVLNFLDQKKISWGIVTNKPEKFSLQLVDALQLSSRTQCVISGDSLKNRKPHPEPLLHACKLLQATPEHCIYVGDSEIDVIASKAAGIKSIAALYGYIAETENPRMWNADKYIEHPEEIVAWLSSTSGKSIK